MSAISASSMPQPTAAPLTAAITGTSVWSSASAAGVRRGRGGEPAPSAARRPRHDLLHVVAGAERRVRAGDDEAAGVVVAAHRVLELGVGLPSAGRCGPRVGRGSTRPRGRRPRSADPQACGDARALGPGESAVGRRWRSCQPGSVLQAQGLSVEVGGRLVVESADFTVMPRDKVGLVGRNGAGKTSLFRVLGGEAEPAAGRVVRAGRVRLPAAGPPHRRRARRPHRASPTSCPAAASTPSSSASRSCASRWRSGPTSATSPATPAPRRRSASTAATPPRARPGAGRRPRPRRRPPRRRRSACCPAASGAASSSPASCSPAATCCASTSRRTTSTSTPRSGCWASCAATAARCS